MNIADLQRYDQLPRPGREALQFVEELRHFKQDTPAPGPLLEIRNASLWPETALASLQRHFPTGPGGIPVIAERDSSLEDEAFELHIEKDRICIHSSSSNGFRYGIYELEERLALGERGVFKRTPHIRHRITRSCFAPNTRPPLRLDELADNIDYYPEAYLDQLAHERMNGVWISVYLNEFPSSFFPGRSDEGVRKLAKLQQVVDQCARYGIRCYAFMAEPRVFGEHWKSFSKEDLARHPEMGGHQDADRKAFCTSSPEAQAYLAESVGYLFQQVRGLGGIINIMCQESSYPCALWQMYPHSKACNCPRCAHRSAGELFSEIARIMSGAMKQHQPDAEFFGWFYAAFHMPGEPENAKMLEIASAWPKEDTLLFNCETGGEVEQMGRIHIVQDYSLSWAGPSEFWEKLAARTPKMAAKIQTGCSHGNASVPYVPVPGILYDRYAGLLKNRCSSVMQCWYFGAYPGLMNRAAARLSFLPFPDNMEDFLVELARPVWGDGALQAAEAYRCFSESVASFPEALAFKWYGPIHHEIIFPWHLIPQDLVLAPSYTQGLPVNSGDLIGECCDYQFTPDEIKELLKCMDEAWQKGVTLLQSAAHDTEQLRESSLVEAIGIQIAGTRRWFEFYRLRNEMIFLKYDYKAAIRHLLDDEIAATERMTQLCESDPRLGYHAEVEDSLFYPAKLKARVELLRQVRDEDLAAFDPESPELRLWAAGGVRQMHVLTKGQAPWQTLGQIRYRIFHTPEELVFFFDEGASTLIRLDFQPDRSRRIVSIFLRYGRWNHDADFQPGITFRHGKGVIEVAFSKSFFRDFRIAEEVPYFFNLSIGDEALSQVHLLPERLGQSDANPADLIALKLI